MRASGSTIAFFNTTAGIGQTSLVYHLAWMFSDMGRSVLAVDLDPQSNLALIKHFKSLMPMAQDARQPMFHLTAADGAIGGHASAVQDCKKQFEKLASRILQAICVKESLALL